MLAAAAAGVRAGRTAGGNTREQHRSSVCGGRRHGGRITRAKLVLRGGISEISISVEYFVREDCDIPEISESMTNLFRNFREDLEIPEISVGSEI